MRLQMLPEPRKCTKCGRTEDTGHLFTDTVRTLKGRQSWEIFLCHICLVPVMLPREEERHGQS